MLDRPGTFLRLASSYNCALVRPPEPSWDRSPPRREEEDREDPHVRQQVEGVRAEEEALPVSCRGDLDRRRGDGQGQRSEDARGGNVAVGIGGAVQLAIAAVMSSLRPNTLPTSRMALRGR